MAGLLAGACGVAVSVGAAWALSAQTEPVVAVASGVRDLTPPRLAVHLVHLVGHADKPLLVSGTLVVLLALCALAGVLAARRPLAADLLLLALGAVGLLAVMHQRHAGLPSVLAVVLGLGAWLAALHLLVRRLEPDPMVYDADPAPGSRRGFLLAAAGVAAVATVVAAGGRFVGRGRRAVEKARSRLRLPITRGVVPTDAELLPGISRWRTPDESFYQVAVEIGAPSITPDSWRLRVHGLVDHELEISYADLVGRRFTEAWITLCCVSNDVGGSLIGNAWWSGVPVREVLAQAGVQAGADAVKQTSYDGWTCGTPLGALTDGRDALLAVGMNGQPLPIEHGFPVRMVVPGLYGYVSATKWLVDLEVTRFADFTAYWTRAGYSPQAPVKTESRIDVPSYGRTVPVGSLAVGGVAWAQHTGVARVEFQLDGGPWTRARLGGVPDNDTWVQWSGHVEVTAGSHELHVRATDRSGYTQTAARAGVVPNGATGWDAVTFVAS